MTGWTAVVVVTGLMLVALAGFNVRLYRRIRAAQAVARERARETAED